MIVIKSVEFLETNRDPIELLATTPPYSPVFYGPGPPIEQEIFKELIRGRRFCRPSDGTDIIVGVSKQAGEVLGIMYEAWDNIEKAYNTEVSKHSITARELYKCKSSLAKILNASFLQRLKWLFLGVK